MSLNFPDNRLNPLSCGNLQGLNSASVVNSSGKAQLVRRVPWLSVSGVISFSLFGNVFCSKVSRVAHMQTLHRLPRCGLKNPQILFPLCRYVTTLFTISPHTVGVFQYFAFSSYQLINKVCILDHARVLDDWKHLITHRRQKLLEDHVVKLQKSRITLVATLNFSIFQMENSLSTREKHQYQNHIYCQNVMWILF